jgi:hypothetical protein
MEKSKKEILHWKAEDKNLSLKLKKKKKRLKSSMKNYYKPSLLIIT